MNKWMDIIDTWTVISFGPSILFTLCYIHNNDLKAKIVCLNLIFQGKTGFGRVVLYEYRLFFICFIIFFFWLFQYRKYHVWTIHYVKRIKDVISLNSKIYR